MVAGEFSAETGGYYVGAVDGGSLILADKQQGEVRAQWAELPDLAAAISLGGFSDWRAPTKPELELIQANLTPETPGAADFGTGSAQALDESSIYWSADEVDEQYAFGRAIHLNRWMQCDKAAGLLCRFVRLHPNS